jgi:hypothetical protein
MAFSGGGAMSGAATGATIGSAVPIIGTALGGVIGGLAGGFMGGSNKSKKSVQLDPYAGMTPEQRQAMALLQQFGSTGQLGDFQAGQGYDFSGFNYGLNPTEITGGNLLDSNLAAGPATGITDAQNALTGMVNAKFDPTDPSNGFAAFQRQLARSTKQSSDAMAQNAAITGNRFGTQIGKDYVNLAAQQSDQTASKLADLWQQTQANKLSAASGLNSLATSQEAINQNKIQQAFAIGQQQQAIQNQKAQASYDDWQRARNERLSSINSLGTVLSRGTTPVLNTGMDGPNSYTYDVTKPTAFQSLLDSFSGSSGGAGGSSIMSMLQSFGGMFGGGGLSGGTGSYSNVKQYSAPSASTINGLHF